MAVQIFPVERGNAVWRMFESEFQQDGLRVESLMRIQNMESKRTFRAGINEACRSGVDFRGRAIQRPTSTENVIARFTDLTTDVIDRVNADLLYYMPTGNADRIASGGMNIAVPQLGVLGHAHYFVQHPRTADSKQMNRIGSRTILACIVVLGRIDTIKHIRVMLPLDDAYAVRAFTGRAGLEYAAYTPHCMLADIAIAAYAITYSHIRQASAHDDRQLHVRASQRTPASPPPQRARSRSRSPPRRQSPPPTRSAWPARDSSWMQRSKPPQIPSTFRPPPSLPPVKPKQEPIPLTPPPTPHIVDTPRAHTIRQFFDRVIQAAQDIGGGYSKLAVQAAIHSILSESCTPDVFIAHIEEIMHVEADSKLLGSLTEWLLLEKKVPTIDPTMYRGHYEFRLYLDLLETAASKAAGTPVDVADFIALFLDRKRTAVETVAAIERCAKTTFHSSLPVRLTEYIVTLDFFNND